MKRSRISFDTVQHIENHLIAKIDAMSLKLSHKFRKTVHTNDGTVDYPNIKKTSAHNLRLAN